MAKAIPSMLAAFARCREFCDGRCFLAAVVGYVDNRVSNHARRTRGIFDARGLSWPITLDTIKTFSALNPDLPPIMVLGVHGDPTNKLDAFFPLLVPDSFACQAKQDSYYSFNSLIVLAYSDGHFALLRKAHRLFHNPEQPSFLCWRTACSFPTLREYQQHNCAQQPALMRYAPRSNADPCWVHGDVRSAFVFADALVVAATFRLPHWLVLEARKAGGALFELRALVEIQPWLLTPLLLRQQQLHARDLLWEHILSTRGSGVFGLLSVLLDDSFTDIRVIADTLAAFTDADSIC
jgi:hypothetical protein